LYQRKGLRRSSTATSLCPSVFQTRPRDRRPCQKLQFQKKNSDDEGVIFSSFLLPRPAFLLSLESERRRRKDFSLSHSISFSLSLDPLLSFLLFSRRTVTIKLDLLPLLLHSQTFFFLFKVFILLSSHTGLPLPNLIHWWQLGNIKCRDPTSKHTFTITAIRRMKIFDLILIHLDVYGPNLSLHSSRIALRARPSRKSYEY